MHRKVPRLAMKRRSEIAQPTTQRCRIQSQTFRMLPDRIL